jgi:hypothetical protein
MQYLGALATVNTPSGDPAWVKHRTLVTGRLAFHMYLSQTSYHNRVKPGPILEKANNGPSKSVKDVCKRKYGIYVRYCHV